MLYIPTLQILSVTRLPGLKYRTLFVSLSKGSGHNKYGEPAWPNDILFVFPIVILASVSAIAGVIVVEPFGLGITGNPFSTPAIIEPEWYFFLTFSLLRLLPDKFLGVMSISILPVGILLVPYFENLSNFQNPFRRPGCIIVYFATISHSVLCSLASPLELEAATPLL